MIAFYPMATLGPSQPYLMLYPLCSQIIPPLPLLQLDINFSYVCWAHKCQKEYFPSLSKGTSADAAVWRVKQDLRPPALLNAIDCMNHSWREVGWVCLAHTYHLTTWEADALSGVAKRVRDIKWWPRIQVKCNCCLTWVVYMTSVYREYWLFPEPTSCLSSYKNPLLFLFSRHLLRACTYTAD